jgi:hypothetical protein
MLLFRTNINLLGTNYSSKSGYQLFYFACIPFFLRVSYAGFSIFREAIFSSSFWGPIILICVDTSFSILRGASFSAVLGPFFLFHMGTIIHDCCG